ncbi:ATP-binding protein [Amaricoccus sp.]|uniref:two-component system sensor histidine kinase NtrB n=1 Tax=Amaricoccus sp. TaxID=1872485 RepID=UPI001B64A17F|nr:ATP-binding protein [Amaricoccus sp.]MBP7241792.1 PAS domain-containing sensor histidine kinase [Amaricoccus sp.]
MSAPSFEAIWGAVPYPALVLGADDAICAANPAAESFGAVSARHMEGRPLGRFLGEDSAVLDVVRQARRSGVSVAQYDILVGWGDQAALSHNIHAAPLNENDGAVLLLIHPLGMADKMDRSLGHRSAARSVTGMAAMLAHEIRNPLAGISGAAQLLEMGLGDADRELTSLIQTEAARIGKLVDRVEQFGDLRPAQRRPLNIHDVLDRARRAARAGFAAHARFSEDYDPSLPPTAGDPDQLLQVFQNLLKNAAEAVPKVGGSITISTAYAPGVKMQRPGGGSESLPLLVTITDNGPGVPEGLVRDIFDPFVSSKVNGTGLGLSLVSKLIADHGGVVECDSRPGRTRFRVRLPVWRGAAPDEKERAGSGVVVSEAEA